ncbi:hypothetical protein HN031_10500 [Nocardioides sp. zg-1308]|uniref:NAD(+)--rifampin ADP-ribosyltransferase n=1 Tax=Nocardioides sp. zg-1308 TaxID=2736253 RepID=UPI0015540F53|nr:hypothetical protein [Nocardioides sp. zg-1308]
MDARTPVTHENSDHVPGPFLHGTKAELRPGDELRAGHSSNFQTGRVSNHIYFTTLESTAAWGAQLATALAGLDGRGHIYAVEPMGPFEDDPKRLRLARPGASSDSHQNCVQNPRIDDLSRAVRGASARPEFTTGRRRSDALIAADPGVCDGANGCPSAATAKSSSAAPTHVDSGARPSTSRRFAR